MVRTERWRTATTTTASGCGMRGGAAFDWELDVVTAGGIMVWESSDGP